ncbi:hypothetical protein WN943_028701 [Citrus x changshan-huyou]
MEALRKVALAYYNSGTDEERRLFNQFFQSMDKDGNGRVSYREFSDFMSQKAHDENMRTRDFFNQLDIDRSGGLDFKEVLTLYYILKSGRPICGQCKIFITNEYFACMKCFETGSAAYSICLECFRDGASLNHNHPSLNSCSESSSHLVIVPYNPNIPGERRGLWQAALKVFEAALPIAGIVAGCSIM